MSCFVIIFSSNLKIMLFIVVFQCILYRILYQPQRTGLRARSEAGVETSAFEQGNTAHSENGGHPGGQFGSNSDSVAGLKQQALTSLQLALRDICRMKSLSDSPADSVAASRALAFVERAIEELEVGK